MVPKNFRVNVQLYVRAIGDIEESEGRPRRALELAELNGTFAKATLWGSAAQAAVWQVGSCMQVLAACANPGWESIDIDETSAFSPSGSADLSVIHKWSPMVWK